MASPSSSSRSLWPVLLAWASLLPLARGQATPHQQPGYRLRASSRIVLTDVTVTDANGHRVGNLRAQDFAITDNGQPETLTSFAEHKPGLPQAEDTPPTQPGTFINAELAHPPEPINVLLLDIKNIEVLDQLYLRFQILKLLERLPSPILFAVQPLHGGQDPPSRVAVSLAPDPSLGKHGTLTYTLRYTLPLDVFTVESGADHPKAQLGFAVVVFNDAGTVSSRRAQELTIALCKDKLPLPPGQKVTVDQRIALPRGDTSLYCAVWDMVSHRVGTVQIPLQVSR